MRKWSPLKRALRDLVVAPVAHQPFAAPAFHGQEAGRHGRPLRCAPLAGPQLPVVPRLEEPPVRVHDQGPCEFHGVVDLDAVLVDLGGGVCPTQLVVPPGYSLYGQAEVVEVALVTRRDLRIEGQKVPVLWAFGKCWRMRFP